MPPIPQAAEPTDLQRDIAFMRRMQDEYDSLLGQWREAPSGSQELANLHATFKARAVDVGRLVEGGLFKRVLDALAASPEPQALSVSKEQAEPSDELRDLWLEWLDGMYDSKDLLRRVKLAVHGPLRKPAIAPQPEEQAEPTTEMLNRGAMQYAMCAQRVQTAERCARDIYLAMTAALPATRSKEQAEPLTPATGVSE